MIMAVVQVLVYSHTPVIAVASPSRGEGVIGYQDPTSDDWPAYHRDMLRSGYDPTIPSFTSVKLNWKSTTLDGDIYAEPPVVGTDVIAATENNSLYELNAANGQILWRANLGAPVNSATLPVCSGDINPSGITGTPVIDVSARTIFVVAFLQTPLHHELFALNLDTGATIFQLPIDPPGANPGVQQQRAALALSNGYVYVAYGGLEGDCGNYHGWVAATNENGAGPLYSYQVPTGNAGAIWGGGDGPVVDSSGNLLVATGNSFSTSTFDFGNAVMKLFPAPTISLLDYFAPTDWATLNSKDLDLGSTEPVVLNSNYLFQIGKEGVGYLLNANNLGQIGGQVYSSQVCASGNGAYGGLAYSNPYLIIPCTNGLVALTVNLGSNPPTFSTLWNGPNFVTGPPIIAGNAVWDVDVTDGLIDALSLTTGQTLFHDAIGSVPTHFNSLSAGDGQIFVSASRQVSAYLPTNVPVDSISSVAAADAGSAWFVLPDFTAGESGSMHTSLGKCGDHVSALATDVYAATYLFGALANPQNEVLDTNSAYISQSPESCGQPTTSPSQPLVAVAGPVVNEVVGYYESVQATAPLYYNVATGCIVRRDTGASVDCSTPTATNDVFVLEAFTDLAGRTVFIIYGRQWGGTLAGFQYAVNFVLKNPSTYSSSWYVYRWQDATSGPSANGIPDPGDIYTPIATGP
jgi:hypothetical protein